MFDVLIESNPNILLPKKLLSLIASTVLHSLVLAVAIITTEGKVVSVKLISGHPMLVQSAMEAASRWVNEPSRLNDEAVSMLLAITVNFRLHP